MFNNFKYFFGILIIAFLFSSCMVTSPNFSKVYPSVNEASFLENHLSKDKKVFANISYKYLYNNERKEDTENILTAEIIKRLNQIHFANFVSKKEDADYFLNLNISVNSEQNFVYVMGYEEMLWISLNEELV